MNLKSKDKNTNMISDWEDCILEKLFQSYYEEYPASFLQTESYNHFITFRLPKIVEQECCVNVKIDDSTYYRMHFDQPYFEKPMIEDNTKRTRRELYPYECRIRELNYTGILYANINTAYIHHNEETGKTEVKDYICHKRKVICKIPVMLNSIKCNLYGKTEQERIKLGECPKDVFGYFIIRGKERCIVSQQRGVYNQNFVYEAKASEKHEIQLDIRSMSEETKHSILLQMKIIKKHIYIGLPYLSSDVSVALLFVAYGISVNQMESLLYNVSSSTSKELDEFEENLLLDMYKIGNKENAIKLLSEMTLSVVMKENRNKYVEQILNDEILPHLGLNSPNSKKVVFFVNMIKRLTKVYRKQIPFDDRDHLNNQRVEVTGTLIADLFRTLLKRYVRTVYTQLEKRQDIALIISKLSMITLGIQHCFAVGSWGIPKSNYLRQGVSQLLSNLAYHGKLSHLRRVVIPQGKESKSTKIRSIHTSQIGMVCPHETPEGACVGIVKQINNFTRVTLPINQVLIQSIIDDIKHTSKDFERLLQGCVENVYLVFVNGNLIVFTDQPDYVYSTLLFYKQNDVFSKDVSIVIDNETNEIHLYTDDGRLQRAVLQTNNLPTIEDLNKKSFNELVNEKKIIYLDSYEIEKTAIAMTYEEFLKNPHLYSYLELHPTVISSYIMSLIPYNDHTQSPRNTYYASMTKQAIGLPFHNLKQRVDTIMHVMHYPEAPILQSHHSKYNNGDSLAFGQNIVCAIMAYGGWNQEDSVILNRGAVERGLLRIVSYRTLTIEEKKKNTQCIESIQTVPTEYQNRSYNYSKLDDKGIIKKGIYVSVGDVVVSKILKSNSKSTMTTSCKDASVTVKNGEEGYVSDVFTTTSSEGYKIIKIKLSVTRIPEVGDKVCSRNAQKGTISAILDDVDMPFSDNGLIPDIIMNPLATPSRMTINQLIESFISTYSIQSDKVFFCTAFSKHSTNIVDNLMKNTNDENRVFVKELGNETFMNGYTGETFKTKVFCGFTYYNRLKHLVACKIHARNSGSVVFLTRQPMEGRSRSGGLRLGEMERDALLSHGLSRFLRERLFLMSDPFKIPLCANCGIIVHNPNQPCSICLKNNISMVFIPYAAKLLFQLIQGLNIKINIFPKQLKM